MRPLFLEGAIISIGDIQTFGEFKKREFVVRTNEAFPEEIKLDFINNNVDVLDKFMLGEFVTVGFVVKGSQSNGRFFVNLRAVAIDGMIDGRAEEEQTKLRNKHKSAQSIIDSGKATNR